MSWFHQLPTKTRHWLIASLLVVSFLVYGFVFFAQPRPASAFLGFGDITFDINSLSHFIWNKIQKAWEDVWKHAVSVAYKNAVRTFTQRIAYDMAVYISSGGAGQKPMFVTQPVGKYLENVADDAAGDFLDTLSKESGYLKQGLCEPVDLRAKLTIQMPMFNEIKPRKPKCSLSDIKKNLEKSWEEAKDYYSNISLSDYQQFFDLTQNDLGIAFEVLGKSEEKILKEIGGKSLEQQMTQGFKNVGSFISNYIKTPGKVISETPGSALESASRQENFTGDVIADALGVFTNTLISRLQKRIFQKGLAPVGGGSGGGPSSIFGPSATIGIEYAIQVNSSLSTPNLVIDTSQMDIISELLNCPDIRYASVNNCTLDQSFATALRQAEEGQALTLREAIAKGYVNGNWKFANIRPMDIRRPDAWYLTDLRKLRKARIIPVGWELAAEKFPGKTLNEVMNGFNDQNSPYWHLIDPDWVLRAPPAQCRLKGAGQILQSQGPNREETCVDTEQCVAEKDDGSCVAWGYCLAEKNTWRFWGDSCELPVGSGRAPYATCQTFKDKNNNELSLLTNSLANYNDDICNDSSVSCRWYSWAPLNTDTVVGPDRYSSEEVDKIYLKNLDKLSCTTSEQGCTAFWRATNINDAELVARGATGAEPIERLVNYVSTTAGEQYISYASLNKVYLREAPQYLNCYDVDGAGDPISANDSPQCKNYASLCSSQEVGCELYTPADGSPKVPAVVQAQDYCPDVCVGFNRYTQASVFFEKKPATNFDFIPSSAQTCPAQSAGCEEFTNLDQSTEQGEKREYYVELRQCIDISDSRAGTFYTWVGSELPGFQLKSWQLQTADDGSPYTVDGLGECREAPTFPFPASNPDCKQFYDINGNIYYRFASKTVSASDSCYRYRATNITQDDCTATNGSWDTGLNACIYNAIPGEGKACKAKYNGCREYRGPTSAASQLLFPVSTFGDPEPITNYPLDASFTSGWGSGQNTKDALSITGHAYASGTGNPPYVSPTITRVIPAGVAKAGHKYLFTFWAKRYTTTNNLTIESQPNDTYLWDIDISTIGLSDDWREYQVEEKLDENLADTLNNFGAFLRFKSTYPFVIDNIVARDVSDTFYLVKNSWQTPAVCEAQFLGCQRYTNSKQQTLFATGFSSLCRQEAVGCEALINTQNSDSPQSETITSGTQTITIPADSLVYRVYDKTKSCPANAEACRPIGQPVLDASGAITSWGDKLVKLDPDNFNPQKNINSPLCERSQDGCEQFTSESGVSYFKDPGLALCEYRQSDGRWYKKGSSELCNLLVNPSFEEQKDHGNNLIVNGGFEDSILSNWMPSSANTWMLTKQEFYLGSQSVKMATNKGGYLRQTIRLIPNQAYTARVFTKADNDTRRTLHVFGCGVDLFDFSQNAGSWEKLQITYIPTTSACTIELAVNSGSSEIYFDNTSVFLAEDFRGWVRNGKIYYSSLGSALTTLSAINSIPGRYWESKVLEIESSDEQYSGVWSDWVDVGVKNEERYFTISANLYVPDIPQNANLSYWRISPHVTPEVNNMNCAIRPSTGVSTCHHYDFVSPAPQAEDRTVTIADKGKWVHKKFTIKADPDIRYVSVGVITNENCSVAGGCRANQVVYVDQVNITEGILDPAYTCPSEAQGCTAFSDPQLTQSIFYYLDNNKLDKNSCNGKVSEKGGCLLFANYNDANLRWNSNATYAKSAEGVATAPENTGNLDTNIILKVGRSRVCAEWATCQNSAITYDAQSGQSRSICYLLGRCDKAGDIASNKCSNWKVINNPQPLELASYQTRSIDFNSPDLSGYTIPHQYPIDTLTQKNYSTSHNDIRLTYINKIIKACSGPAIDEGKPCTTDADCVNDCKSTLRCGGTGDVCDLIGQTAPNCSDDNPCSYADVGIDGSGPGDQNKNTLAKLCRIYPQPDAPFPSSLAKFDADGNIQSRDTGFKDANICQTGEDCECNYKQVKFSGGEQRYYSFNNDDIPERIRVEQDNTNQDNTNTEESKEVWSTKKQEDLFLGLKGYCLEKDDSRSINNRRDSPCLTWLPLDILGGELSIYDYAPAAGYQADNSYYCSQAKGNWKDFLKKNNYSQNNYQYATHYKYKGSATAGPSDYPYYYAGDDGIKDCGSVKDLNNKKNWYCGNENYCASALVDKVVIFPVQATDVEKQLKKDDIHSIIINVDENTGGGYGGHYLQQDFTLNRSNNWCTYVLHRKLDSNFERAEDKSICTNIPGNYLVSPSLGYGMVGCNSNEDWVAIKAVFDSNSTKLLGYNMAKCDGSPDTGGAVMCNFRINLFEYCTNVVQTTHGTENKAWTDRILRNNNFEAVPGAITELGFNVNRSPWPYGRITKHPDKQLFVLSDKFGREIYDNKFFTVSTPFGCQGVCGSPPNNNNNIKQGMCISDDINTLGNPCNNSGECGDPGICTGYIYSVCESGINKGKLCTKNSDCGSDSSCVSFSKQISNTNQTEGVRRVQELFAKVYDFFSYDYSNSRYISEISTVIDNDISLKDEGALDTLNKVPHRPDVREVMFDSDKKMNYEGNTGFTLSSDFGSINSTDGKALILNSPAAVTAKFYAYNANGEQMPLTEVRVDWFGDYLNSAGAKGKYKNHKHMCQPMTIKNSDNIDIANPNYNFGDSTQACIDDSVESLGYFSFTSILTCSVDGAGLPSCSSVSGNKACWDQTLQACVYKPRVYVEDNWEWCATGEKGNKCDPSNNKAWLNMSGAGKIIVYP